MNVLSLFDGVSCGRIALDRLGVKPTHYFASEIDKNAIKCSKANWDDITHIGDVTKVRHEDGVLYTENGEYEVEIDLILAGSPCQGFSFSGKQLNFDDPRSRLYFEFTRIKNEIESHKGIQVKFLLENVRMRKPFEEVITSHLGVQPLKINSRLIVPQNRLRYYWTNIPQVALEDEHPVITSILEDSDYVGVWTHPRGYNKGGIRDAGVVPCVTTSSWQHNFKIVKKDGTMRMFTPIEIERCQSVPDNYTSCLSDNQRYKVLGNGWTVAVIEHILSHLFSDKETSTNP